MDRWLNRVAVVTGASSGVGEACCKDLVSKGMVVVGLARREERLQKLKGSLPAEQAKRFHGYKCDVSDEKQVIDAFAWIEKNVGGPDVLVNNAAVVRDTQITKPDNSEDLRAIIETNLLGVSWCTREAFLSQQRRKVNDGHIVIINSTAGHGVPIIPGFGFNLYAPSKHGITALTEVLRLEFQSKGTQTKITSVSPGAIDTEMIDARLRSLVPDFPKLLAENVADALTYCIQTPPHVQIHELTIRPVGEKF